MVRIRPQPVVPFTYEHYRALPEDGRRHELIGGDFYVTPAPAPRHQTVSRRLQYALMTQLELPGIALVFDAPVDVLLSPHDCLQPDLLVLRTGRRHLVTRRAIEGPPDVVVEILSPSTRGNDEFLKKDAYARLGVPEYWLVEPKHGFVTVLRSSGGKVYDLRAQFDRASTLTSEELPEIAIPLAPVFADPSDDE